MKMTVHRGLEIDGLTDRAMAIVKMLTGNTVHLGHGHVKLGWKMLSIFTRTKMLSHC